MQDSVKRSMEYVDGLHDNCVYTDGYRCIDVKEDDFIHPDPDRHWTPGPYLEAWSVSYRDFLQIPEMTEQQKQLKHYKIGFTENDTQYIILYQGLLLPMLENGKVVGVMRATYGLTTKYWIDKKTLKIDKRLFLR
ncbi:MAG: hypothetical protein WB783_01430 [Arenicellales bacterium]